MHIEGSIIIMGDALLTLGGSSSTLIHNLSWMSISVDDHGYRG